MHGNAEGAWCDPGCSTVDVSNNRLTGSLPPSLANLAQLTFLNVSLNRLVNSIPAAISALTQLQTLDLMGNAITGTMPSEISALAPLMYGVHTWIAVCHSVC